MYIIGSTLNVWQTIRCSGTNE